MEQFQRDPEGALEALHDWTLEVPLENLRLDNFFTLSELSFLHAQERERRCEIGFVARRDPRFPIRQETPRLT